MKSGLILLLFFLTTSLFAQQKTVAITIDDLPFVRINLFSDKELIQKTDNLLASIEKHNAMATGLVNLSKVYISGQLDSVRFNLLQQWLNKGFDLGNHTFSHPDYNHVSYSEFINDVEINEPLLKKLVKDHNRTLVYFRHPYLHRGNSKAKADSLAEYLRKRNYVEAPVTIDNDEWIFAAAYDSVLKTRDERQRISVINEYITYMESKVKYYERQSGKLFGRNISQILLIHANSLNSDCMTDLLQLFVNQGYSFVSLSKALEDKVYQADDQCYTNAGISWLDRWAVTRGKSKDFFQGEPVCPESIMKLAKVD